MAASTLFPNTSTNRATGPAELNTAAAPGSTAMRRKPAETGTPTARTRPETGVAFLARPEAGEAAVLARPERAVSDPAWPLSPRCLLYTSDAADDLLCVDLGG